MLSQCLTPLLTQLPDSPCSECSVILRVDVVTPLQRAEVQEEGPRVYLLKVPENERHRHDQNAALREPSSLPLKSLFARSK